MLRVVLDEGVSREVVRQLVAQGHTAEHALDLGLKSQPDPYVFIAAQNRRAVLCSSNRRDYVMLEIAWRIWGVGAHYGLIVPRPNTQPMPREWVQALTQLDASGVSLTNRVVYI